jgi:hypothetical protein
METLFLSKSKSKSHYDWRSVNQHVLVSSQNLGLLTRDFFFLTKVIVLSFLGSLLWREVWFVMCQSSSLKSTVVSQYLQKYLHLNKNVQCWTHLQYDKIFTIYTGLVQSRLGTADYALVTSSLHYNDSLDTWTVVHMTAAKFEPLIFAVSEEVKIGELLTRTHASSGWGGHVCHFGSTG